MNKVQIIFVGQKFSVHCLIDLISEALTSREDYINKKIEYENILQKVNEELVKCSIEYNNIVSKKERLDNLHKILNEKKVNNKIISEDIIKNLLNKIVVKNNNEIDIYLNTDIIYTANINKDISSLVDEGSRN